MVTVPIDIILLIFLICLSFIAGMAFQKMTTKRPERKVETPVNTYKDPGPLPGEPPNMWVGTPGEKGQYLIMLPIERDDDDASGEGGLNRCFGFDTREEAVAAKLKGSHPY